jgi:hypothetical protein
MMKLLFSLALVCFCFTVSAQIPNYVAQNGLVGWWPFNGNANDESGNGNNGNNLNGAFITDRLNNINAAFYGSGINSGINITGLNNFPFGNSERTISVWFKCVLPYPGGDQQFFAYGGNNFGTRFSVYTTGDLIGVEYCNGAVRSTYTPDSLWHNILVTYNGGGSSGIIVYMDGQILSTNINTPTPIINTENSFIHSIGCLFTANYFNGSLDDIGIWNRVLNECEIQDLYQSQLGSLNTASTQTTSALDTYTWPLNNQTYTQSGTFSDTIQNAAGCDSTITLNLTLNFTGINELGTGAKKLVKITDLNGKVIPRRKNTLMLFIYEDGTVERVVEME